MKYVKKATTYPGADVNSDHNPVVVELQLRYFARVVRANNDKRIDIKRLDNPEVKDRAIENLELRLQHDKYGDEDVEPRWNDLKKALTDTQKTDIGYAVNCKKQQWITDEILQLMEERREVGLVISCISSVSSFIKFFIQCLN